MRILSCKVDGQEMVCVQSKDGGSVYPIQALGMTERTINELIENFSDEKRTILQKALKDGNETAIPFENVTICPPIPHPRGNVICLGENYCEHARESRRFQNQEFHDEQPYAIYFDKKVTRTLGDGEDIDGHFGIVTQLDYESELAVILGKSAYRVQPEDVRDYIFGYSVANDISARDLQFNHKQFFLGKSLDGFFAMGPVIVTADEIPFPPALNISCYVNGELRQSSRTDHVYFDLRHIICELSQGMTLPAGTIIITGTPSGVGMGMQPPTFLKKGDVVRCEIESIGSITNRVQ